ncbi:MAG: hypothetical protein ABIU18_04395 [Novosphingobium sp.]
MIEASKPAATLDMIESVMRAELAHGDALIGTIIPIMRHLVTNDDSSVFSEELVARTRAMLDDVASQLLVAHADAAGSDKPHDSSREDISALSGVLSSDSSILAHVHALAAEWQLTERLHARLGLDPLLSPLLQALIASRDAPTATAAMNLLAAQARFAQTQRRMQLPLAEFPADLLHAALVALRSYAGPDNAAAMQVERAIAGQFDESHGRLGLMARLLLSMGGGAQAALSVSHGGAALFLTALSLAAGQERCLIVLSTNEGQLARLALSLAAAGLKQVAIEEQFLALHPDVSLPEGFETLDPDHAAAVLASGASYPA